ADAVDEEVRAVEVIAERAEHRARRARWDSHDEEASLRDLDELVGDTDLVADFGARAPRVEHHGGARAARRERESDAPRAAADDADRRTCSAHDRAPSAPGSVGAIEEGSREAPFEEAVTTGLAGACLER